MIEIIAMCAMFIDHLGAAFFPDSQWLRAIGRISFPLYAWLLVVGYRRTRNVKKYLIRLAVIGLIAQAPYSLLFETYELNVVFTLWIALLCLTILDRLERNAGLTVALILLLSLIIPVDYGPYGILLVIIYDRYERLFQLLLFHALLNALFVYGFYWPANQFFSLAGTLIIFFIGTVSSIAVNRTFYRSFYPAHLLLLLAAKAFRALS